MPETELDQPERLRQREAALSRWDTEGGAGPDGPQEGSGRVDEAYDIPASTNGKLLQLCIRGPYRDSELKIQPAA